MRLLNPQTAADGQGSLHFKWPFLHLLILFLVFNTFLIPNISTKSTL